MGEIVGEGVDKSVEKVKEEDFRSDVRNGKYKRKNLNSWIHKTMEEYIQKVKVECEPSTYERYDLRARHLAEFFGAKSIDQIEGNKVLKGRADDSPPYGHEEG